MEIFSRLLKRQWTSWLILIIIIAISAGFFMAMKKNSRMETDLDKYMPQNHPAFLYSDKAEEWFDIKDGIVIAIENKEGIYNSRTIGKIRDITEALQDMEEIEDEDVTSLYTADNIIGTEDGMDVMPFFESLPESKEELDDLRNKVHSNDMVYGRIVSTDDKVAIVIARIGDDVFSQKFHRKLLDTAKNYESPETIHVAGRPIVEGTMAYLGPKDMKRMVPIVISVIALVLFLVLRSVKNVIFTLLVVLFSSIWTFGLMAVLKIPIYAVSTMIPVMLIAIGVADGIHMYSHLELFTRRNRSAKKELAIMDMFDAMWKPVMMTSITTAVGFFSLLTSQVYPIKYFGIFTAFGVMVAMSLSLILIPVGIRIFGLPKSKRSKEKKEENTSVISNWFTEKIIGRKYPVLIIVAIIMVISVFGITKVWINSSFLDKFEKNSDIVLADRFINDHFGGTSTLNVILESKDNDAFKVPQNLRMIDSLQSDAEKLDLVGNSFSLSDYLKRMNKVMYADQEEYNKIPDSQELVAQYLLLYEVSGDPEKLWQVVDYDYRKANLTIQIKSDDSKATNSVIDVIERYKPEFEAKGIKLNYAGSGYKSLVFTDLILKGHVSSLLISLVIVIVLVSIMFKNIKVGLIGSVPIIITSIISFGVMGLLDIPLSTTTALISSIAIGIGIDYAIHFIERYKEYAKETNDRNLTSQLTMHHTGRAILFNAIVVIGGFMVLMFSVFPPNRALGALVSLNMFISFLGTITIMFILLYLSNIYFAKVGKIDPKG